MRSVELVGFAVGGGFLINEGGFRNGGGGRAFFLELFSGWPIDERGREFLPFFALGAVVAYTVAFDLILCDGLIGAVFEDEAVGEFLGGRMRGTSQDEGGYGDRGDRGAKETWLNCDG